MLIIGIAGPKQHGKSTLANLIENAPYERTQRTFGRVGVELFAGPLKRMVRRLLGEIPGVDSSIALQCVDGWMKEVPLPVISREGSPITTRMLLQYMGSEGARAIAPDFWVRMFASRMDKLAAVHDTLIIPDVRFVEEADFIRQNGGIIVRVIDPRKLPDPASEEDTGEGSAVHVSERGLPDWFVDIELVNDADKAALLQQFLREFKRIKEDKADV